MGFVINLALGNSCLQSRQTLQLQSAEAVLAQVPDHLSQFRGGCQGTVGGSQGTGSGWRFLVGDQLPAVLDHELAVALLQDLHLDACKAGPFLAREQLQSAPLRWTRLFG